MEWFLQVHMTAEDHVELICRLTKTIWRRLNSREDLEVETRLCIHRLSIEIAIDLLPLVPVSRISRRQEIQATSLNQVVVSLATFFLHLSGRDAQYAAFKAVVYYLKDMIVANPVQTSRCRSKKSVNIQFLKSITHVLTTFDGLEDTERVFEQEIIRKLNHFGECERDLWALGVIKGWICFTAES